LIDLVQGFREVKLPRAPEQARDWEIWQSGRRVDFRGSPNQRKSLTEDTLYYGRMYLPTAKLEGMHIRRASPTWQYMFSFVSDQRPGKGSAVRVLLYFTNIDNRPISTGCWEIFY
jgi:distribution and morphology protein 10